MLTCITAKIYSSSDVNGSGNASYKLSFKVKILKTVPVNNNLWNVNRLIINLTLKNNHRFAELTKIYNLYW